MSEGSRVANRNVRRTRRRAAVLEALEQRGEFVSAQELHALMISAGSAVGLTTVYRALNDLEHAGLVDVVHDSSGGRLYLRRSTTGHRHYLICRCCGRGQPIDAEAFEEWAHGLSESTGFTDLEHTLELSGTCRPCRLAKGVLNRSGRSFGGGAARRTPPPLPHARPRASR
ncbi:transcriptional repressor [Streptomyces sp. AV19]|uniref:Fur family transcriptional regulator n=1 Tax=Streptomyces sp. AV19 TaxID=2793068 RepID=UPI0018FE1985|nr:transcriptional repressor [Streptomyces sp. AV19]MBH1938082.1 transcriptional repressor [Streptomyces sp. AV19]MDG4533580.1 transcriptional repressor [Streptomyces sp. AV19]